jgi:hypothetical protein
LGNAIHTLLLEPGEFSARYIQAPTLFSHLPDHFIEVPPEYLGAVGQLLKAGKDWVAQLDMGQIPVKVSDWSGGGLSTRSSAYRAWKQWTEAHGFIVLTRAMAQQAYGAADTVRLYEPASDLIANSAHEVTLVWQDAQTGLWCKGRMDNWDGDTRTETDLKTTGKSVHHEHIGRTACNAGWHIQRAFYGMGVEAITGEPVRKHKVIAVEMDEPWRCEVYRMGEAELELGRGRIQGWIDSDGRRHAGLLEKYAYWQHKGEWPMNSGHTLTMEFPGWALRS